MTIEQIRLSGGALNGKVVWVEHGCATLSVHIGGQLPGATKTLHYRRSEGMLQFEGETQTVPAPPGNGG
jgi:hypothetical protein